MKSLIWLLALHPLIENTHSSLLNSDKSCLVDSADLRNKHETILNDYFEVVDVSMDSDRFSGLFADDAAFKIWHFPTSIGREQIAQGCQSIFNMVKSLSHDLIELHSVDESTLISP
jgi:hypothetical protein